MTNHIHFLVTPHTDTSLSKAMSVIGSRYAYYFNRTYKRSGTIWEGRHKSSLIQSERYLLTCMRYIELNPVVANMVSKPEEYKWSSYMVNAWSKESALIHHEEYLRLDKEKEARCYAYRELFKTQLSEHDMNIIKKAEDYCQPVGDDRFKKEIEEKYGIKLGQMSCGRAKKAVG
jgi:putative transposase